MAWLSDLVEQHSEYESPKAFWYWSALASVSAVLKDSVYLDKFLYKLYPNIYVMLHAQSGLKKGAPISMAKQLVREVNNTRIISGRSSIQGILKKLGTAETKPGGRIIETSSAFICSSELTSSLVEDKAATTILTDLFDRNYNAGEWESLLKMETFMLKDTTVSMLGGTNQAHADDFFLKKDVQGGYFARTCIIYENKEQTVNSLMFPPTHKLDYKQSAQYLKEIAKLKGPLEMKLETRLYFDNWYKEFKKNKIDSQVEDPTGTLNRFDDTVLKIAILISLGTIPEPIITSEAVHEAIMQCEQLIGNVRKTTFGQGKSAWAQEKALLIQELLARDNHMITRQQLNKKFMMRASALEWDDIVKQLEIAGVLHIEQRGANLVYFMDDSVADAWIKHMKGEDS